jgi:LCP family protein required for cell wall assembly
MVKLIAGKAGYGVLCLLAAIVLTVAGYAHKVVGITTEFGKGVAISGAPSTGPMNILVMGLESRTDYQGNELDHHMQVVLHSGSNGSQDTNTLILIHIFAGGKKAVGFSIPRDDLVTFPQKYLGYSEGKIDAAYAWAYTEYLNEHPTEDKSDRFLHANQAGQQATIDTVESVTGVKVDHFMEVNLMGFYYLAQAFGGIEVCLQPYPGNKGLNLTDYDPFANPPTDNSGFDAYQDGYNKAKGGAQYLHLNPAQSLAFVRSRDTLPGTDLGRTKRQQAALDYVIYQMKHEGLFSDFSKLTSLLGTASKYLITDSTMNLLEFAPSMSALNGESLNFTTLPFTPEEGVSVPGYPQPQDLNVIDVPSIQKEVQSAFYPGVATPSPSGVTVDVYNGNPAANGLATQVSQALTAQGYQAGKTLNSTQQTQPVTPATQVFYGAGASAQADQLGLEFGATAASLSSLPAGHVEVLTGSTVTQLPAGLAPASTATQGPQSIDARADGTRAATGATASPSPSATASATTGSGAASGSVTVSPSAPYGIPCVY